MANGFENFVTMSFPAELRFEFSPLKFDGRTGRVAQMVDEQFNQNIHELVDYQFDNHPFIRFLVLQTPATDEILSNGYLKMVPLDYAEIFYAADHILRFNQKVAQDFSRVPLSFTRVTEGAAFEERAWGYEINFYFVNSEFRSEKV